MIVVRKCEVTDAETIQMINEKVMNYSYPLQDTRRKLEKLLNDACNGIFAAEYNGEVAGYIHLHNYDALYFPHMKNVLCLAVLPEYRRKGIASKLLSVGEKWAKETGAAGIRLDSGSHRLPAHACYEKAGYEHTKMHKYFIKLF